MDLSPSLLTPREVSLSHPTLLLEVGVMGRHPKRQTHLLKSAPFLPKPASQPFPGNTRTHIQMLSRREGN